jgi:CubicO group peptidase (beta-lactamase class C family)
MDSNRLSSCASEPTGGCTRRKAGGEFLLDEVLERLTNVDVPGIAVVKVSGARIERSTSSGKADLASGRSTSTATAHLWFSMTKIVTATAVMQLAERGTLKLDDPVDRLVEGFPKPREGWPEVRVRHLLSHSSGLTNPIPVRWVHLAEQQGRDPREFAKDLLRRHGRLRFPAGSKAVYSNPGYIVLGELISTVSGQSYEDYVTNQILTPLSMSRTGFGYENLGADIATGYQRRLHPMTPLFRLLLPKGIVGRKQGRFLAFNRFLVDGPAYGGLVGSAMDAARFLAVHLNDGELDGGRRLLSSESVRAMQTIQASGRKLEAGFGWFRRGRESSRSKAHLEHLGGGGGFWNMMRIYPDRRVGVVAMGNATRYDHEAVARAALGWT